MSGSEDGKIYFWDLVEVKHFYLYMYHKYLQVCSDAQYISSHSALFSDLVPRVLILSKSYVEAGEKYSGNDPFADLDGAEVDDLEVIESLLT